MATALLLSSDLMFTSRLVGAAATLGTSLSCVPLASDLAGKLTPDCRLVMVDLTLSRLDVPVAVEAVRQVTPEARIVAFGPHVDEASLAAAKRAGCDVVLSRAQFNQHYVELLKEAGGSAPG